VAPGESCRQSSAIFCEIPLWEWWGMGLSKSGRDGSQRALRPAELIRFDLKSETGPATFKRVALFPYKPSDLPS
jgi:hypothetical protein